MATIVSSSADMPLAFHELDSRLVDLGRLIHKVMEVKHLFVGTEDVDTELIQKTPIELCISTPTPSPRS